MAATTSVTQSSNGSKKGVLDKTWLYRNMHKLYDSNNFAELNASDWWTLTRLIKFANEENGYCNPSYSTIGGSSMSESTVKRSIKTLEEKEIITVIRKRRHSHIYRFNFAYSNQVEELLTGQIDLIRGSDLPTNYKVLTASDSVNDSDAVLSRSKNINAIWTAVDHSR